jgi:hypothetical protein
MIDLLKIIVILFGLQPLVEYTIHFFLHNSYFKSKTLLNPVYYHHSHHLLFKNINNYVHYNGAVDTYLFVGVVWFIFPSYWIIWIGILKYEISHFLIHRYNIQPYSLHHKIHHLHPKYNYSVTAIWPDRVFNTYKGEL